MLDNLMEKETLPISDQDLTIPTRVSQIDTDIVFIQKTIADLQSQLNDKISDRNTLLARAKDMHITTDKEWKIVEVPVYPKKHVDVELLKKQYKEKYDLIIANRESTYRDKLDAERSKILTDITQADLKAVVKDKGLLAMLIPEQTIPKQIEYSVVKRC